MAQPTRPAGPQDRVVLPDLHLREREAKPGGMEAAAPGLPLRWVDRISALSGASIVHIPAQFRERIAVAMCQGLEDLLAGGLLEMGRTKLLLAPIPRKFSVRTELNVRLQLWFAGTVEELLVRVEEQARNAAETSSTQVSNAGRRAAHLTRSGAFSKAVSNLTSSVATLTSPEQRSWAEKLLPCSGLGTALAGGTDAPAAVSDSSDFSKASFAELRKSALKGVKFGALSGAGPSGMRPEHLDCALLVSRRSISSRLLRGIARSVSAAGRGTLPESAHWLTQSRLVYLSKPSSSTPRPIRVGEVWRRIIGKRLVADSRDALQELFLKARQCGVAVPGGCEVLIHARRCLDSILASSADAYVMLDLDLRNAFPSLEWSAIRAAVAEHMPSLAPWTSWCHGRAASVQLPDGSWHTCDRGAEQGDPLGPVYCALTLLAVSRKAMAAATADSSAAWDGWYMDDSQNLVRPHLVGDFLQAFDDELERVGGSRVADGEFKSTAYLCGSPDARAGVDASWESAAAPTCRILPSPPTKVLGVGIVGASVRDQFRAATAAARAACEALQCIDDAAAELALLRISTNVCRVAHFFRAAGPDVPSADLDAVDEVVDATLSVTLGGPVRGLALERASLSARHGGLGLLRARELQLPAFLASRTEARALAAEVTQSLPGTLQADLFSRWDEEVASAFDAWTRDLEPGAVGVARQMMADAATGSQRRAWQVAGDLPGAEQPVSKTREFVEQSLLGPPRSGDPESEDNTFWNLQTQLCSLTSARKVAWIRSQYAAASDDGSVKLIDDLCDSATDHSWLWLLASHAGPRTRNAEFCTAVRLRIGADVAPTGLPGACCGEELDPLCQHATRCAPGESNRGHYVVCSVVHGLSNLADPSASSEPRGLVPSRPAIRPADVLTSAAFCIPAALDVCVASPDAAGAGTDACIAAAKRKREKYRDVLVELHDEGYDYRPLVWTCWGRPSVEVQAVIRSLASVAARRRGLADPKPLEMRARALIGAQIWRRAAAMALACLCRSAARDARELLPADGWEDDVGSVVGPEETAAAER